MFDEGKQWDGREEFRTYLVAVEMVVDSEDSEVDRRDKKNVNHQPAERVPK
jgi:hypothetical protein